MWLQNRPLFVQKPPQFLSSISLDHEHVMVCGIYYSDVSTYCTYTCPGSHFGCTTPRQVPCKRDSMLHLLQPPFHLNGMFLGLTQSRPSTNRPPFPTAVRDLQLWPTEAFLQCQHIVIPAPFVENTILSALNCPGILVRSQLAMRCMGLFLDSWFYSINVYRSILIPVQCCLDLFSS